MAKPKKIFLLRHGQSAGNIDKTVYNKIADYQVALTPEGYNQAGRAGDELKKIIGDDTVMFYISPYLRTRQTAVIVKSRFDKSLYVEREDPRLREHEWSTCIRVSNKLDEEKECRDYGLFYYRFKTGESCADLYDGRISTFLDTLHRDFEKKDFPNNVVLVMHGMSARILLMRWMHWTVEHFCSLRNLKNCEYYLLEKNKSSKYDLITKDIYRK
jgi:broad specificity phosphatase PhoE